MNKPLSDIVVLDMARYIAGPYCATLLAEMGAYVIKLEKPKVGEEMRNANYPGITFTPYNLNKRSLVLDVRNPKGIEIIKKLLPKVDILIQNFRAGTMEKMGLGEEVLRQINPRLIVANISGFGQTGPYRDRVAFDGVIQAESGLADSIAQETGGRPYLAGGNPCDVSAALFSAFGVLAALNQRDNEGIGQSLDIDMFSAISTFFTRQLVLYAATGETTNKHPLGPCGYCKAKDAYLRIDVSFAMWQRLRDLMKLPILYEEKYEDPQMRMADEEKLIAAMETWTMQYTAEEALQKLSDAGISSGIVKSIDRIYNDKHLRATNKIIDVEVPGYGPLPFFAMPFSMSSYTPEYQRAPLLGEHTDEVMSKFLQLDTAAIAALKQEGVIG